MIQKSMTEKALAANRHNAQKATGPKTESGKETVSQNAVTHGILAQSVRFKNAAEEAAFNSLMSDLNASVDMKDPLQRLVAEEFAMACLRRERALALELEQSQRRNPATKVILKAANNSELLKSGVFMPDPESGWDCTEISIAGTKDGELLVRNGAVVNSSGSDQRLQLQAKFQDPLAKILRYQQMTGRDFYRAWATLHELRRNQTSEQHRQTYSNRFKANTGKKRIFDQRSTWDSGK
jgi:hypothetical protein